MGACEPGSGADFVEERCAVVLRALELRVVPRAEYPDEFMDGASFTLLEPAPGTWEVSVVDQSSFAIEEVSVGATTEAGGSRSRYAGRIEGTVGGGAVGFQAELEK